MNNLTCPTCKTIFDFKNMFAYDNKQMKVECIIYQVKCLKCGDTFISDPRSARKLTKKESKELIKKLKEKLDEK